MTLKIKTLEAIFGIKIKKNVEVLGLDTASKTGICLAKSDNKVVDFSINFINVDVKGISDRQLRNQIRYEEIYKAFKNIIKVDNIVVIEDVFHSFNAQTTILLSRIGAIAWTLAKEKGCSNILWRTATQARKALGLPCNKKKKIVMETVNELLGTDIDNSDEIDAIVLALNGLIEN
jgi:Holliday junction resolvasome RuvABC endonuclease subunit